VKAGPEIGTVDHLPAACRRRPGWTRSIHPPQDQPVFRVASQMSPTSSHRRRRSRPRSCRRCWPAVTRSTTVPLFGQHDSLVGRAGGAGDGGVGPQVPDHSPCTGMLVGCEARVDQVPPCGRRVAETHEARFERSDESGAAGQPVITWTTRYRGGRSETRAGWCVGTMRMLGVTMAIADG